ncbi:PTS sugar transporter subunit IIA [Paraliobacillus salinarum]|uniref:PTS sugar transporter subunit IIA n=1 Tax=Paraliobacillus salinarum TaxID=1158996 RepID=UPI0015F67E07|nr:PTS sugar transporter subunit IIA [Paraliobacillus salinarum]
MPVMENLYQKDLILSSNATTQEEVFSEISQILLEKGIVKDSFKDAIVERELNYPTGLDLSPVAEGLPNVAIPHTETEHCDAKVVVFVKLTNPIVFHSMIAPDNELNVNYLFMIINNEKTNQTNVLSELMAFMTDVDNVKTLEALETNKEIYDFLTNKK